MSIARSQKQAQNEYRQCLFRTTDKKLTSIILNITNANPYVNVKVIPSRLFGRCFSFYLTKETTGLEVTAIDVVTKMNTLIYLHHPNQFMSRNQKGKVVTKVNKKLFIDIHYEITQNRLGNKVETICNDEMNFRLDECIFDAIGQDLEKRFGCTVPFIPLKARVLKLPFDRTFQIFQKKRGF